jgi:hypothetical protein
MLAYVKLPVELTAHHSNDVQSLLARQSCF